jgi:hypothetical protein
MTTINTPSLEYIVAIDLGQNTVVTFLDEHHFTLGEIVSFRITKPYGTVELNNVHAKVINLSAFGITVDYDSTGFTPFIYPATYPVTGPKTPPVVVPSSSGVLDDLYTPEYTLQDSFDRRNV